MLEVKNISKTFKIYSFRKLFNESFITQKKVFKNFSLTANKGFLYHLQGKNGSGKTTLFKILSGYLDLDEGEMIYNNKKLQSENIVYIDDNDRSLFWRLSVHHNIKFFCEVNCCYPSDEEIVAICSKYNLKDAHEPVMNLSKGQKQIVKICIGLLLDREVMLFDESLSNIDKKTMATVSKNLNELISKKLLIFVAHNFNFSDYFQVRALKIGD